MADSIYQDALGATRYYLGWPDEGFARDLAYDLALKAPPNATPGWHRVAIRHACLREAARRKRFVPLPERPQSFDAARVLDVERELEKLPATTVGVMYLRLLGYDYEEIGARVGCVSRAARDRVSEAVKRLRGRLCLTTSGIQT